MATESKESEESPEKKDANDKPDASERSILLQQQFPVDAYSRLSVFFAILAESPRQFTHPLQTIASIQEVLDVLCHHLGDITELIVQLVKILRRATVLVQFLCALDKGIKLDKGIGTEVW